MIHKRRKNPQEDNVDSWLMTYADMITLLLCFFIVFVSVSEPKKEKLSAVAEGMAQRFGFIDLATPFQGLLHSFESITETHRMLKDIGVEMTPAGIKMELAADAFFKKDSAELIREKLPVLLDIAAALKSTHYVDYRIIIEGHTNDVPVSTPEYPSNWELSSARAVRLVRLFIEQGIDPKTLRAVGYADSMPEVPNLDTSGQPIPENRAKNERMVIRIEKTE